MNFNGKTAQEIQDEIFRQMPAEKKIRLVSDFFSYARKLNPSYFKNGTAGHSRDSRKDTRKA